MGKPKESVEASGVQIGSILSFSGAARFELIDGTRADTTQMGAGIKLLLTESFQYNLLFIDQLIPIQFGRCNNAQHPG
jgi:hypothetical protein